LGRTRQRAYNQTRAQFPVRPREMETMPEGSLGQPTPLDAEKFRDADTTATGDARASVALERLSTLWINTGTLCNITCVNCYIESSPSNDRLAYIRADEVRSYLDEIARDGWPVDEIGFTGGEPFMNPDFLEMLDDALQRGLRALVLTNAMKPLWNKRERLAAIRERHGDRLCVRVSVDHFTRANHEALRGPGSWKAVTEGLGWLAENGFAIAVAGRTVWGEAEETARAGYAALFSALELPVDARDAGDLVLFPEMDANADVPEITTACWGLLDVDPASVMCATSRMVVKRKGAEAAAVVSCTLLPYEPAFEMGRTLAESAGRVKLNHPHCAKFCVLGGASCAAG
jgi:uncharacterized Fe-S cluster-containing radical SAM superfamily protein